MNDDVLLDGSSEAIDSLDALLDKCLPWLTARVWQTCCWPDSSKGWTIGDFRFSIVEFEPAEDVTLYVQLWSEPHEPVLMEVSSGNWNPGALRYVWHQQRKALEQRGFVVGGAARNFQKELGVASPDDAEAVAREVLAIIFDVFGYRGLQPLTMKLHGGSRSKERPVHTSLTPEDFAKIARQSGFHIAVAGDEADSRVIALERGLFNSIAIFGSPIPRNNLFRSVLLRASVRGPSQIASAEIGVQEHSMAVRFIRDGDGSVRVETFLHFDGGVTTEWIVESLHRWVRAVRKYQRAGKKIRNRPIRPAKVSKRRLSIH